MSLREEIAWDIFECMSDHYIELNYHEEMAIEIINKVLDAVCAEINNVGLGAHNTVATINAVNKLRGE